MRDHSTEYQDNAQRKYAYDFDSVVRRYLMRSLEPFIRDGKALEIGCFEGESSALLAERFADLTVLEPVAALIEKARAQVPARVQFVEATIETAQFEATFESVFLVHTLEHLDDPVGCLARIRTWLTESGRLYLVVPNANAASRQIAVKMGLIASNQAVTDGEREHGHRCTYSLDTLERDARGAGLGIESRGGVFFKPFANFQFDLMLEHKVIDQGYLDGCYALGMQYPELSASVFVVCGR